MNNEIILYRPNEINEHIEVRVDEAAYFGSNSAKHFGVLVPVISV